MNLDPSKLMQAVLDQLTMLVPVVGALVAAWLGRRIQMVRLVKREAVKAEETFGAGKGEHKHGVVKDRLRGTITGRTYSSEEIDRMIKTHGRDAAHAYRESIPPEAG